MLTAGGRHSTALARAKRAGCAAAIAALIGSAVVGGNPSGIRDTLLGSGVPAPKPAVESAFAPVRASGQGARTILRSQPWWQGVTRLKGVGRAAPQVTISGQAIQWRVWWSCGSGRLVVRLRREAAPLIDATCPAAGSSTATQDGHFRLQVATRGSWHLAIEQQLDVPLIEPPLPAMTASGSSTVAVGMFQRIDQFATGRVTIYRLADRRYAMRFTGFYVTPNVDLEVRLSSLHSPHSTHQYLTAPSVRVAPLAITAGSLDFMMPAGVDPTVYHSVVIWCPLVTSAYAEAPLRPVA